MILGVYRGRLGLEQGQSLGGELASELPLIGESLIGAQIDFSLSTVGVDEYAVLYLVNKSTSAYILSHFVVSVDTYKPGSDEIQLLNDQQPGRYGIDPVTVLWHPEFTPDTLLSLSGYQGAELLSPINTMVRTLTGEAAQVVIPVELSPGSFLPIVLHSRIHQFMSQVERYSSNLSVAYLKREVPQLREELRL